MTYLKVAYVVVARICGTPVLGCRSRLGRSLVASIALRFARRPVDHRTSALPTSASRHDLHTDSTDGPPDKKKQRPLPCTLPSPGFTMTHQHTLIFKAEA